MKIATIGLDIAKRLVQAHGVDAAGRAVVRRKLGRGEVLDFFRALPPCLVGIEACGTAHHWARGIGALGHEVRLLPAADVKPHVKRGKTDPADAEAICEAMSRPTMRFVPVKTPEQQAVRTLHRTRDLLVRQRTMPVNALRGDLAGFGIVAWQAAPGRHLQGGGPPSAPPAGARRLGSGAPQQGTGGRERARRPDRAAARDGRGPGAGRQGGADRPGPAGAGRDP